MSARSIFVAAMLILVAALFFYLLDTKEAKREGENAVAPAQPATVVEAPQSNAGNVQTTAEANEKPKTLTTQQEAAPSAGVSRLYLAKCSSCHGRNGRGPIGPSIAGKSQEENLAILMKYKNKQAPNSAMLGLLEKTSDQELEMLAKEIAAF
ncbi:MAG: c-type cytochrome [Proteobacteria bacterium]|nr:c-type cytochrome [Pseudomonadota bacterium]